MYSNMCNIVKVRVGLCFFAAPLLYMYFINIFSCVFGLLFKFRRKRDSVFIVTTRNMILVMDSEEMYSVLMHSWHVVHCMEQMANVLV